MNLYMDNMLFRHTLPILCGAVFLLGSGAVYAEYREEWLTGDQLKQAQTTVHDSASGKSARRTGSHHRQRVTAVIASEPSHRQPSLDSADPIAAFSGNNRSGAQSGRN
ncbi:hypothetical protein R70211_05335 [Paraburkholderia domus]|uniref:Uncharacterized protein n=2 Tax=Paraburkholderia domus TaxID=2793075 RepID=A0A9N8N119_9BURK|nr:hypothetical protein R70211_05335 [Paraburkholderia domus]